MSNQIPDSWQMKSVGELCSVKRGASPRPIQDPKWWGGTVGWVRISDVTSSKKYLKKTTQYLSDIGVSKSIKIPKGEVVLSICATIGRPIIINVDACIHDGFVWFNKLEQSISREFWYYFLISKEEFLSNQRQSGTQGNLNTGIVSELQCLLPPLPEQQKIAAILTSVDEVIEKTQAQIDKLKDLKSGMMQELLTKGVGIKQGDKYEPHIEFKDSPVGRIPKSWEVQPIADLCSHVVDCVNKTAPVVDFKTPYKMIRTTNVRHGRVDTENVRCVSKETYENWTRRIKPENGDLIFTREAPVGECGILEDSRGIFLGQRTMMYRANEKKTSSGFLMYSLMSEYGRKQLENFSGGSTVPHMRVPDCGKILIKTPPLNEQNKILGSLNSVDFSILQKEKKLAKLLNLKKALMQDLLTGKVRVKVDNDSVV